MTLTDRRLSFVIFLGARAVGIVMRPLVLFLAIELGQIEFSNALALFVSAVAASFVVLNNEAHAQLYRSEFNDNRDILLRYILSRRFVFMLFAHGIFFMPLGFAALYLWTESLTISALGCLVLIAEKTFDEIQRYYLLGRRYVMWSVQLFYRVVLPSAAVIVALWLGLQLRVEHYVGFVGISLLSFVMLHERRRAQVYAMMLRRFAAAFLTRMADYARDYVQVVYRSHFWGALAGNILLIDRLIVSRSGVEMALYVLFANIFNIALFAHTLLYFTPRRPHLIRKEANLLTEVVTPANLGLPVLFGGGCVVAALLLRSWSPDYAGFNLTMMLGLGAYYVVQCWVLVITDFVYWRVDKGYLLLADLALVVVLIGGIMATALDVVWVPVAMSAAVLLRGALYVLTHRFFGRSVEERQT